MIKPYQNQRSRSFHNIKCDIYAKLQILSFINT